MTAMELLQYQIDDAGYQLEKVFEGIEEKSLDFRLTEQAMTPRELMVHLCETYYAVIAEAAGQKHEWGTYQPETTEWPDLFHNFKILRARAVEAAMGANDWCQHASAYIPAHEYYHVGQMSMLRIVRDKDWNPYSIYKG